MFRPVSSIPYTSLAKDSQFLSCGDAGDKAAARFDAPVDFDALFRDLLANPHIRAIVLVALPTTLRRQFEKAWEGDIKVSVPDAHLVRQYVDLYDDVYIAKGTLPAYCEPRRG